MNELKIFDSPEFGQIRTVVVNNQPMFCLVDVCKALDLSQVSRVKDRLTQYGVTTSKVIDSMGREQEANFISESNLYKTIFQSRKESAERFTEWVTSEVLPSIRKTGMYRPGSTSENIRLLAQGHSELEQKIDEVKSDLVEFRETLPLLALECERITKAVTSKGVNCMGGKDSNAYHDKSTRTKVYSDIHREVRRQFGVDTYKAIRRNQVDKVISIINGYKLPLVLQDEVLMVNAQESFEVARGV